MNQIDESLFAVLRAVTLMIHVGETGASEKQKWFDHIKATCALTQAQAAQLEADIQTPPDFELIKLQIRNDHDRQRLVELAHIAMLIDGKVDPEEQELYERFVEFGHSKDQNVDLYTTLLIEHVDRVEAWKTLDEIGRGLRARSRRYSFR